MSKLTTWIKVLKRFSSYRFRMIFFFENFIYIDASCSAVYGFVRYPWMSRPATPAEFTFVNKPLDKIIFKNGASFLNALMVDDPSINGINMSL